VATRRTTLKPDPRGDYRPYIGIRKDGKQQRFNLGADPAEAERRRDRVQQVYRESMATRRNYGLRKSWTEAALHAAKLIQQGFTHVPVPSPHVVNEAAGAARDIGQYDAEWSEHEPFAMVWSHTIATRHYPSVNWVLSDGEPGRISLEFGQQMFDVQARRQAKMMKAEVPKNPVAGTFHEALDAYDFFIENEVSKRVAHSTKAQRQSQVKYLKRDHDDVPLAFLEQLNKCRSLFDHWTSRPQKGERTKERYSHPTCKHRISELSMFFDWLHGTDEFDWRKPPDFDTISKTIARDRKKKSIRDLVSNPTFSIEDLTTINSECRPLERLLLYLGLNCCFGAAESGRLENEDLFIREKNPLEHMWLNYGFASEESESWIAHLRPKTDVAGCWWLWPETVAALECWLDERPSSESERIIVSKRGKALYRDHSKNAQSGFAKLWTDLLERVRINNGDIPKLPFGTLRDQFSDWSVYQGENESGSMALAHGTPFKDEILACYANRPFPLLFDLQKRYREELQQVFDAA
jgi:hypothetical protein